MEKRVEIMERGRSEKKSGIKMGEVKRREERGLHGTLMVAVEAVVLVKVEEGGR